MADQGARSGSTASRHPAVQETVVHPHTRYSAVACALLSDYGEAAAADYRQAVLICNVSNGPSGLIRIAHAGAPTLRRLWPPRPPVSSHQRCSLLGAKRLNHFARNG